MDDTIKFLIWLKNTKKIQLSEVHSHTARCNHPDTGKQDCGFFEGDMVPNQTPIEELWKEYKKEA